MTEPDGVEEQISALLADARHREPMPSDVAARLDATLGDLLAARRSEDRAHRDHRDHRDRDERDALAERRRRRRFSFALAAAAAVVVGGVSVSQVLGGPGIGESSDEASSADAAGAPESEDQTYVATGPKSSENSTESGVPATGPDPLVRPGSLRRDIQAIVADLDTQTGPEAQALRRDAAARACVAVPEGARLALPVAYGQEPGALLVIDAGPARVRFEVYRCSDGTLAGSGVLPR